MQLKTTLAVVAAAAVIVFAVPEGASALPQVDGAKQLNSTTVEKRGEDRILRRTSSWLASRLLSPQLWVRPPSLSSRS
jgi:hypothetical protein